MSREAIEAVQDHSQVTDPTGLTVFLAIARFVKPNGEPGWASYRTLASVAHCDKDTAARWVGLLEKTGELGVRREGSGRGARTYYTINLPFDQPKHGGAGRGDNKAELSPLDGDNSMGTFLGELSQRIDLLSQQIALLSQQLELMSPLLSHNVPTMNGTETKKPKETKETGETRARDKNPYWDIPAVLHSEPFLQAWSKWLRYVDEAELQFTETQAELMLGELTEVGPEEAVVWIEGSIKRNYKTVFPPRVRDVPAAIADTAEEEWQRVVELSARGKLRTLPEGPVREAVIAVGSDRIDSMTVNQKPFVQQEFTKAYERACRHSVQ